MKRILVASMMMASAVANATPYEATEYGSIDLVRNALKDTYNSIGAGNNWGVGDYAEGSEALAALTMGLAAEGQHGQVSITFDTQNGRFELVADNFEAPTDQEITDYMNTGVVDDVVNGVKNDIFGTEDLSGNNFINDADGVLSVAVDARDGLLSADFTTGLNSVNTAVTQLNGFGFDGGASLADIDAAIDIIQRDFEPVVNKANEVLNDIADATATFRSIDQNHYNNYRVDSYIIRRVDADDNVLSTHHIIPLGIVRVDSEGNNIEQCYVGATETEAYEQYALGASGDCPTAGSGS